MYAYDHYDRSIVKDVEKAINAANLGFNPQNEGHQIRIEISSSNFPRFTRNLNTGGNNFDEDQPVVAKNKVHHSDTFPSQIRLPIVN